MIELVLPYPPSVNHYWFRKRGQSKDFLGAKGKEYRVLVMKAVREARVRKMLGRLRVEVDLHAPDARIRDLDNTQKAIWDALKKSGAYHDDSQIDDLHIRRMGIVRPDGRVVVRIASCDGAFDFT